MKELTRCCNHCNGTGREPLPDHLKTLLSILAKGEKSAQQLSEECTDRVTPNAWNNRLEHLRELGLVTRRKDGRVYFYSLFQVQG